MPWVNWVQGGSLYGFCPFATVDLTEAPATGVYVIFVIGSMDATTWKTVKIGYGDIAKLISADRADQRLVAFAENGTLEVTWGEVRPEEMDGIACYLRDALKPLIRSVGSTAPPIKVNVPGSPVIPPP
jgi:hypothetical protein